jgi:predicted phage baseplate assembly protein
VKDAGAPTLDPRKALQVLDELRARWPAYVPELKPREGTAGWALLEIFARHMEVVIERLNQAPDKNLLAFLDMLGISLIPAQAARAPVVFEPLLNAGNGRIEARTRLGARVSGRSDPVMFETESAIALAAARLVEVKTLWPARDEYADHTTAVAGGRSFTLFKPSQAVPHVLYLAHDTLFAFAGKTILQIEFELVTGGNSPLEIVWEYWDGQVWRPLATVDGTDGFMRSGVFTLRAECGRSVKTKVCGIDAYWVRGWLNQSLSPDPSRVLPLIDRIGLKAFIERKFESTQTANPGLSPNAGLLPDHAFAEGSQLDVSKEFYPFGRAPDRDNAFYFTSHEIFSKPAADVTVHFRRAITPEDEADNEDERLERDVNHARNVLIKALKDAAQGILDAAKEVNSVTDPSKQIGLVALKKAVADFPHGPDYQLLPTFPDKVRHLVDKADKVVDEIDNLGSSTLAPPTSDTVNAQYDERYKTAKSAAHTLFVILTTTIDAKPAGLASLGPIEAAAAGGTEVPQLLPPRLVWEYWDGRRWKTVVPTSEEPEMNFLPTEPPTKAEISFRVPGDISTTSINGVDARWMRIRIQSGSYKRLRIVSWYDAEAGKIQGTFKGKINFFPLIEQRPPALDVFALDYVYRSSGSGVPWSTSRDPSSGTTNRSAGNIGSSSLPPEHCLTYNDFQFELHSHDVRWPGSFFPPCRPVADTTPALYLGFDHPLPNDLVSLYLDIQEGETAQPPLLWEAWDGTDWCELQVTDETADLQRPGMVSFIAPEVAARPQATISQASGSQITVSDPLEGAAFQPGDRVVIQQDGTSEMAAVQKIQGAVIELETPLARTYTGGTVSQAALPRFGTPLDWVRARLKADSAPAKARMNGIYLNAAWAVQIQTINDELLGSGTGQPNQTLFFRQIPILPGEQIEVRELEGARAHVEWPILKQELLQRRHSEEDIRAVTDPRTGRIMEVWVRWRHRPHLFFSGPDDRHYTIERVRGRLIFGDGQNGRIPPVGPNNIRVRRYQTGGGLIGNVPAGKITQLLSVAPSVQAVTNPRAADGGAEGETTEAVKTRGPQRLRHRGCALAARDYEALAREASPGVAAARALPATAPNGRPAPGWVTVIIVPQSQEPRPQPSFELRRRVHDYLAVRAPATVAAGRIAVIGPTYLPIGVAAIVAPRDASEAGAVKVRVRATLERFLHPLSGGPEGRGWPFGRDVYLSDVAVVLESVEGVDYARELNLLLRDTPQGERIAVPPDRIVVAGTLRIEMQAAER